MPSKVYSLISEDENTHSHDSQIGLEGASLGSQLFEQGSLTCVTNLASTASTF